MGKGKAVAIKRGIYYNVWINGLFFHLFSKEEVEKKAELFGISKEKIEWEDGGVNLI